MRMPVVRVIVAVKPGTSAAELLIRVLAGIAGALQGAVCRPARGMGRSDLYGDPEADEPPPLGQRLGYQLGSSPPRPLPSGRCSRPCMVAVDALVSSWHG